MVTRRISLSLLLTALLVSAGEPGVPPLMNYQGKQLTPSGQTVSDGNYSVRFTTHDSNDAGAV